MTLDISTIQKAATDKIGYFRFKKLNGQYLITNDVGKYHVFSSDSFQYFLGGQFQKIAEYDELVEKGFIKNGEYEERMSGSVMRKNHFVGSGPGLHMIVVTLRCNHKCRYCHAAVAPMTAKEYDMTKETAKKVVDAILYTNLPSLTIEFQGGEALVNYEVVQFVVEYARTRAFHLKKNVKFTIVSNLTLMTEEKLAWLLDNDVSICTSLDGSEAIHNFSRTGFDGNSYEVVTYWMKRISQEKEKRGIGGGVSALLTATKETLPKYKEIIDTYNKLGLNGVFLRWLNPYGFAAADLKTLSYSPEEWMDFYEKSLDYVIELNKKGTFFREDLTLIYLQKIFNSFDPSFMDIRSPSGIAVGGVAYNYDGKVYASDESRMLGRMGMDDFFMTNVVDSGEETYKNMMESDITKIAVQSSTLDGLPGYNDHVYKPYVGVDIIHNFKTEGSVYVPLPKDQKMKMQIEILDVIFMKLQDPEVKKIFMSWL